MLLLPSTATTGTTFGCKASMEKDFVCKLQKSTYINRQHSRCIWSLQPWTSLRCLCCKRPCRIPLSCHYSAWRVFDCLGCHQGCWSPWHALCFSFQWLHCTGHGFSQAQVWPAVGSEIDSSFQSSWEAASRTFPKQHPRNILLCLLWKYQILAIGKEKTSVLILPKEHIRFFDAVFVQPQGHLINIV